MNSLNDKLATQNTTKKTRTHIKFDGENVAKITKIRFPEESSEKMKKAFKINIDYVDKSGKSREKTIFFGDKTRRGCEYIDHKNKDVRDKFLLTLPLCDTFFQKNFMVKFLLNGKNETVLSNWEELKLIYC